MVRMLSLNITDGGTALHRPLLARLTELAPDLLTLQEIRSDTVHTWRQTLERDGMHVDDTFELAHQNRLPHPRPFREDGLLIQTSAQSASALARLCTSSTRTCARSSSAIPVSRATSCSTARTRAKASRPYSLIR